MKSPKIRFKGFDGDWEQRKLGEVFQEYSEKNHPELPALTIIQGVEQFLEMNQTVIYSMINQVYQDIKWYVKMTLLCILDPLKVDLKNRTIMA